MPEMSNIVAMINNNISNSFITNMQMQILNGMLTLNGSIQYDILMTDNTG